MRSKEREAEKKNASEKKEKSTAQNILGTIAYIVGVCVFVFLILHFVGQRTVVNGSSMDTTLANGQNLVMDKLSYRFHDPERYDIIIFPGPGRVWTASILYQANHRNAGRNCTD